MIINLHVMALDIEQPCERLGICRLLLSRCSSDFASHSSSVYSLPTTRARHSRTVTHSLVPNRDVSVLQLSMLLPDRPYMRRTWTGEDAAHGARGHVRRVSRPGLVCSRRVCASAALLAQHLHTESKLCASLISVTHLRAVAPCFLPHAPHPPSLRGSIDWTNP